MMDWGTLGPDPFRHALAAGLGRALLHVRQRGDTPDKAALWEACLTCQTYDWALEGHRAEWLWTLVADAGLTARWADPLLAALPEATTIPDADQRAGLVLCLARAGHGGAPIALEALIHQALDPALALPGARELIQLHGVHGLQMVFTTVGRALRSGDDRHLEGMGSWMMAAEDILGVDTVARTLSEADDPNIRTVHDAWTEESSPEAADVLPPPGMAADPLTAPEREHLYTTVRSAALALAAGRTPAIDVDTLARSLARLTRHPPAVLDPLLLTLDAHPDPRVRRQLSRLLSGITDPLLRALALQGPLGHPNRLRYLIANFEPLDARRIQAALEPPLPTTDQHDRCGILLRLHEARPDEDWVGSLLHIYAHAPSSLHREEALVRMVDDETAPQWLVAEACWDAHPAVAEIAREAELI